MLVELDDVMDCGNFHFDRKHYSFAWGGGLLGTFVNYTRRPAVTTPLTLFSCAPICIGRIAPSTLMPYTIWSCVWENISRVSLRVAFTRP